MRPIIHIPEDEFFRCYVFGVYVEQIHDCCTNFHGWDLMDKIVSEHISGQLLREGKSIYVRLKIEVKEYTPDESPVPIKRLLETVALSPMSGIMVEDGDDYILRYTFEGKQTEKSYRVQGGKLYAGWIFLSP